MAGEIAGSANGRGPGSAQPGGQARRLAIGAGGAVAATGAYLGVAAWLASSRLRAVLEGIKQRQPDEEPPIDPLELGYRGDPGQAFGIPFEEVMIATPLGDAPAWLVHPADGPGRTWAIFVHGVGGRREEGYRHLSVLRDAGITTLLMTYRNDEGAPADPSGLYAFGLHEWRDLDAAVAYALAHGAARVILDGESMGGAIVGQFLRHSRQVGEVAALILDSPALDMRVVSAAALARSHLPLPATVATLGLGIFGRRFLVPIGTARSIDAVAAFPGPLFLAHGDRDPLVPVATSDDVAAKRHAPTVLLRTRAEHIRSWYEDPARYRDWLTRFLAAVPRD